MQLFEDYTPEMIRSRILARLETSLQTREGSFIYDMVSPVSFEIWRLMMTLSELVSAFYVDEFSGQYLDMHAELLALSRRQGTKATAVINFVGTEGTSIPAGTAFFTAAGLQFNLVYDVTIAAGTGIGYLQAAAVGDAYNVDAGEISQILRNVPGLTSYINEAAAGGSDPESDEDLFSRIDYRRKNPSTSGNESHYKEWALSRNGIGGVKVIRLWNGPGTVKVLVVGYNWTGVDDTIVSECAEYIETQRPVGADVTVHSAVDAPISVSASVTVASGASVAGVRSAFVSELDTYLKELSEEYFADPGIHEYTLHINRVAALLMNVPGVVDYSDLQINGTAANVVIDGEAVPVIGEVDLT